MNWEESESLPGGFTLWTSRQPRYWAVTQDRDGRGVVPRHDLNHPITKKAALESWEARKAQEIDIPEEWRIQECREWLTERHTDLLEPFSIDKSEAVELDRR